MAGAAAARLRKLERELRSLPRKLIDDASTSLAKAATRSLVRDAGADRRLRNAPTPLRVIRKVTGDQVVEGVVSAGPPRGRGQWSWLEKGTEPHQIGKGTHPGHSGKRTWSRAITPEVEKVRADIRKSLKEVMR